MIECKGLVKSFGNHQVIKKVNLNIINGQVTSLVGKNGAGKSTLIGLIAGYYRYHSGSIIKKSISIMPDADAMYVSWTGMEFLKFISKIKKADITEAIALAKELGIYDQLKTKIGEFSFGMKKKLSFIQCSLGNYDTYIFDEPTSGVDVPSAIIMMNIIHRLKEKGAAILLTSHNIDELERISDYVYILENGVIVKQGTVKDIVNKTQEPIYMLVSPEINTIKNLPSIQKYVYSKHDSSLELVFTDTTQASEFLKKIVQEYTITEFYQKRRSLIESVYEID